MTRHLEYFSFAYNPQQSIEDRASSSICRAMARSKAVTKAADSNQPPPSVQAVVPTSRLRFPLLVILSIVSSSLLYTAVSPFTKGDLATVSAHRDQWWEITGLLSWKVVELAVGWWGGYDSELPRSSSRTLP